MSFFGRYALSGDLTSLQVQMISQLFFELAVKLIPAEVIDRAAIYLADSVEHCSLSYVGWERGKLEPAVPLSTAGSTTQTDSLRYRSPNPEIRYLGRTLCRLQDSQDPFQHCFEVSHLT